MNYSPEQCLAGLELFPGKSSGGQGVRAAPWARLEILPMPLLPEACSHFFTFYCSRSLAFSLWCTLSPLHIPSLYSHFHFFLTLLSTSFPPCVLLNPHPEWLYVSCKTNHLNNLFPFNRMCYGYRKDFRNTELMSPDYPACPSSLLTNAQLYTYIKKWKMFDC